MSRADNIRPPLALTMGDPAGVGLDISIMAWLRRDESRLSPFVLYGDPKVLAARATRLGAKLPIEVIDALSSAPDVWPEAFPVLSVPVAGRCVPGRPDPANASSVIAAIRLAVKNVEDGLASAVVTNPIAKSVLYSAGFEHPGHTEFLAALADERRPGTRHLPVMLLADPALKVVPLTIHVPLVEVPRLITHELIVETGRILHEALVNDFAIPRPRLVVAGLNPHAGEGGDIGREEIECIQPAVVELQGLGINVRGPLSADTMFHAAARQTYDAALCMYHDQALIPIKTLAFETGVNVTLGLPFVRTSPDHGTAFDLAGSGRASPASLIAALRLAGQMADARAASAVRDETE